MSSVDDAERVALISSLCELSFYCVSALFGCFSYLSREFLFYLVISIASEG